ncbi:hypothetical protein ATJ88_2480 [Isoptericola jiangsuensis]|uniref:Lipoprotein n=1 Tax=Isoptericola jiangsuensis TaxID=548579 RepID=A0A2A9EZN6_9MICO|nr:hypothetical protein [Isoptericola jiangsuensis]PFG43772.1 hypothetical protein ATJ88_2480 [Isoptericola jiangsuensis]
MRPRRLALAVGAVGLTVLFAACTDHAGPELPTPTATAPTASPEAASPTPTLSPEEAAKQENIAAAEERYEEYLVASDAVLTDPSEGNPLETIRPYIGSEEMVTWWTSVPQQFADQRLHQEGTSILVSTTLTGYEGDPLGDGTQVVTIEACVDFTDVTVVDADGNPAEASYTATTPVIQDVVLQRQPDDRWTIQEASTRQPFAEC